LRSRCGDTVSLDHPARRRGPAGASGFRPQAGIRNITALAATCSQVANAAQNIMICAVGLSSHETGEVVQIGGPRVKNSEIQVT
jgi:hypothetical protein